MTRVVLFAVFLGLGMLLARSCANRDGRNVTEHNQGEVQEAVSQGSDLIRDLDAFRVRNGIWPMSLDEVTTTVAKSAWMFEWHPNGYWRLSLRDVRHASRLRLRHNADGLGSPMWFKDYGHMEVELPGSEVAIDSDRLNTQPSLASVPTLQSRIKSDGNSLEHYIALCHIYHSHGDVASASSIATLAINTFPQSWWPSWFLAVKCRRDQPLKKRYNALKRSIGKNKDLIHLYILARSMHDDGLTKESIDVLSAAVEAVMPRDTSSIYAGLTHTESHLPPHHFLAHCLSLCLKLDQLQLADRCCQRWLSEEMFPTDHHTAEIVSLYLNRRLGRPLTSYSLLHHRSAIKNQDIVIQYILGNIHDCPPLQLCYDDFDPNRFIVYQ